MLLQLLQWTILGIIAVQISYADVVCYRKHKVKRDFEFCAGIIRKTSYETAVDCCGAKGSGFAVRKVKIGKNRFRCRKCKDLDGPIKQKQQIEWGEWGACSVSCGAGWRTRYKQCVDCDRNNFEENAQSQPCIINFYCPVHGSWGPWFPWQSCSRSCGTGARKRVRRCNYPAPAYNGDYCKGRGHGKGECNKEQCPVNGKWTKWSPFEECSVTCGVGTKTRHRTCTNPSPSDGGRPCRGNNKHSRKCVRDPCPVDGGWSTWLSWSSCDVTCEAGHRSRSRVCNKPLPVNGGKQCKGDSKQITECDTDISCPADGAWSEWVRSGTCRAPRCGKGYQFQQRACTNPAPSNGGKHCDGSRYGRAECMDTARCPVDGHWCEWADWSPCSLTCSSKTSLHARRRDCACPAPLFGGSECHGQSMEVTECTYLTKCDPIDVPEIHGVNSTLEVIEDGGSGDGSNGDEEESGLDEAAEEPEDSETMEADA